MRDGCDVFLTELKAAAIDIVAEAAARDGRRVVFLRNRPVADRRASRSLDRAAASLRPIVAECAAVSSAPRRRGTPPTVVVRSDYGLPYSKGLMAQSLMATGLPLGALVRARAADRGAPRRAPRPPRSSVERAARGRGGGRRRRRGRAGAGPVSAVVERARPRAAAAGAARRRDRRRQVHRGHAAGGPARDPARDRHRPGAPGRAGVLLARVPARRCTTPRSTCRRRCPTLPQDASGTVAGFMRQAHDIAPGPRRGGRAGDLGPHADGGRGRAPAARHPEPGACASGRRPCACCSPCATRPSTARSSTRAGCRRCGRRSATWRRSTGSACCRTI